MGKPKYIAFYSYRGGVGRTMAMCNVAARMAAAGDRVVVIDLDLEAPGASVVLGDGKFTQRSGLVECYQSFKENDLLTSLEPYVHVVGAGNAKLRILPAGRMDEKYAHNLARIDLVRDFSEDSMHIGQRFFESLREAINALEPSPHYVLVDSRPGFSLAGAIAVKWLADEIVFVCGLNRQSLAGLRWARARMAEVGDAENQRMVHCVLSPAPARNDDFAAELAEVKQSIGMRHVASLPFDPDLVWRERLLIGPADRERPLSLAYDGLTEVLRDPNDVHTLVKRARDLLQTPGAAMQVNVLLNRAYVKDPDDLRVLKAFAHFEFLSHEYVSACEYIEQAARLDSNDSEVWKIIDDLYELQKDNPSQIQSRLETLYADKLETASSFEVRHLLAWFSIRMRQAAVESGNVRREKFLELLQELRTRSAEVQGEVPWKDVALRLPLRKARSEIRQDMREWKDLCSETGLSALGTALDNLVEFLGLLKDVSGVVQMFGYAGFGFLATDDGEESIFFNRSSCVAHGRKDSDYIVRGEVAVFDLEESNEPKHPWSASRVRFPQMENVVE